MPKAQKPTKIPLRDKVVYALHEAKQAKNQDHPVLETLTPSMNKMEVIIPLNLERSYKQAYNLHISQLHQVGRFIKKVLQKDEDSVHIRNVLGLTRHRYYQALAVVNTIHDPAVIAYIEDLSPNDFYDLNRKEMDYCRNAVWVKMETWEERRQKDEAKELEMKRLLDFLFS